MLKLLTLGSGYRTYLVALLVLLQAVTKLLMGDHAGALDIFTSAEMTQALEGIGIATFRAALPGNLAPLLDQMKRNVRIRSVALVFALGLGLTPAACASRYDGPCLKSCGEDCLRTCEDRCRIRPESPVLEPGTVGDGPAIVRTGSRCS
ncbi:MAG: hypothetical protein KIT79_12670 [Deltaproteobacteria bacterium]|nr:hypothetical protein [Deltaproteobacteria bacterium]